MQMNLKEGDCYVINYGENLTVVDFDDNVSLAEKMQAWQEEEVRHGASIAEWMEQKLSLDNESEGTSMAGRGVAATANGEMAVVGSGYCGGGISWERRATDGGKSHKKQRMQRQGRKKRQQLCNKLETIVAIADGATRRGRSGWPEIRSGHDRAERWGTSPLLLEYCNR
ncbi:hypothetical protein BHE74_00026433 [Ensete ventricosum]|nr:hypothetical protein GW17_00039781 [Ensete ventricosum]RWW66207.1 hypothetical protein BHE74_00026433 [Ensete ventricosum]